jgi:anti-sigma factor ChrR (cupin superfamily)
VLSCREVAALATDYAEGRLRPRTRLQMWMHLAMCALCRRYLKQLAATRAVMRHLRERSHDDRGVPDSLRTAFRRWKSDRTE